MAVKQVFNTSAELDFPNVLPTLDLDFANSKTLDPRITFTRSSGGSYVGADGLIKYAGVNEARFDHDPETGESLGLLVEESRTNLVDYGNTLMTEFTLNGIIRTPNASIAPDGTNSATEFIEETSTGAHSMDYFLPSGTGNYTHSIFIKKANSSGRYFTFRPVHVGHSSTAADSSVVEVDLDTESFVERNEGIITSKSLTKYPNGWFRLSVSLNIDASTTSHRFRIQITNPTGSPSSFIYRGDGTSGFYVWGAQVEQGAFPTSYIPTQGSTRTRAADTARIIGKNFSEWYRQDEGTINTEIGHFHLASPPSDYNNRNAILFRNSTDFSDDITIMHRFGLYNTNIAILIRVNGVFQIGTSLERIGPNVAWGPYEFFNISVGYEEKNTAFCRDGLPIQKFNSVNIPTGVNSPNELLILQGSGGAFNGWIKRLAYFPKRLPNAQLQALTR